MQQVPLGCRSAFSYQQWEPAACPYKLRALSGLAKSISTTQQASQPSPFSQHQSHTPTEMRHTPTEMLHLLSCCSAHDACKGSVQLTDLTALADCLDFKGQYQTRNVVADSNVDPSTSVAGICVQARASSEVFTLNVKILVASTRGRCWPLADSSAAPAHVLQMSAHGQEGLPPSSAQAHMWPSNHSEGNAGDVRLGHVSNACTSP